MGSMGGSGFERVFRTSVAMLYSNLVTRPTGEAVRIAIEEEIRDTKGPCLSILDFTSVGVIDFSCADEVVAKLLIKYQAPDRPADMFFVVQGASEHHRDLIESVLRRHKLALVAIDAEGPKLWGVAPSRLREAWEHLVRMGRTAADQLATASGVSTPVASAWLRRLAARRLAVPEGAERYASLGAALRPDSSYDATKRGGLLAAEENLKGYEGGGPSFAG